MDRLAIPDPAGSSIPVPTVRSDNFAWARAKWATQATVWPTRPPRLAPLTFATHLMFALFVLAALAGIALFLAEYLSVPSGEIVRKALLGIVVAELVIVLYAVLLRRINIAAAVSRLLLVIFVPSFGGLLVLCAVAARAVPEATEYVILPMVPMAAVLSGLGAFMLLAIVVSSKINNQVSGFGRWRASVLISQQAVFPDAQRVRSFANTPEAIGAYSGELQRRLAVAEQLTDPLLEQLLVMPGVTIVKGIQFPGERTAHVGHAVVSGNQIALIDSFLWAPGVYVLDAWGRVVRDHKVDEDINISTAIAAQRYAADRPQLNFRSWAVAHCLTDSTMSVDAHPQSEVRLVSPEGLLGEVGDWLAPVGEQVDTFALQFLVNARRK